MGKVFVTGAGGFIGSHLIEELVKTNANVRAFIRYNSRNYKGCLEDLPEEVQDSIEVIFGDLCDFDSVRKAMKKCSKVFHLGALIAIPYSYIHPLSFVQTNIVGTANLLNACLENNSLEKIVHTSTSEVYGTAQYVPMDEKHPLQAQSPYAASKISADKLVESYYFSFQLPVTTIRLFNTFGPRQSFRAIIPTIISQAIKGITIKLGNRFPKRDFLFVKDTIQGFIQQERCETAIGKVVNVGSGKTISIDELVHKILDLMGVQMRIELDKRRVRPLKSEVMQLLADTRLARTLFGWAPNCSLEDGLRETIEWYENNLFESGMEKIGEYLL